MSLRLSGSVEHSIRAHGRETYPDECCGALIGRGDVVYEALALANVTDEGPRRRFSIRPSDYRQAEQHASQQGLELIGFYHSHPDHPARPSQYDLDHAWPVFAYVIVAVEAGRDGDLRSWRLRSDRSQFDAEDVDIDQRVAKQ
ncbi:MAG: Mov34/MPN/PAD-1 family protein [Vicinamibacterales bacterium]